MADMRYDSVLAQFTLKCSVLLVSRESVRTWGLTGNFSEWMGWRRHLSPYFRHLSSLLSARLSKSHFFRASSYPWYWSPRMILRQSFCTFSRLWLCSSVSVLCHTTEQYSRRLLIYSMYMVKRSSVGTPTYFNFYLL